MHRINLQLFAEGDTTPEKKEDTNLDKKPETAKKDPFAKLMEKFNGTEKPEKKPDEKKPDEKPEVKPEKKPDEVKTDKKETDDKQEPEFDEILYNKEKVKIPVTERQTYLQKGYNYDKVKQTADNANATLQRIARAEGFKTVDEYLAELDKKEKANLAERIEEAAGDPDKIDEIIENHPKVIETREEARKNRYTTAKSELSKDQFFKELEPELDELMEKNPTADPNLVYSVLVGNYVRSGKMDELIQKTKESAVKATIADVHDKERRAAPTGGDTGEGKDTVTPSEFTRKLAGIFGVSASKVAQRSHEKMKGR
jgi:hypothetical protein